MARSALANCSGAEPPSQTAMRLGEYLSYWAMPSNTASPVTSEIVFRVRYAETDQMKVVYHANYLVWCEMGRTDLISKLGTSYADVERQGIGLAVIDASLRYHAAAKYEETIRVRTTLVEARSRTVTFDYLIENADTGVKLVSARTVLASINENGKLVSMPDHLRKSLESAVA
jgi:acyl-CoA thioester hydrolase